MKADASDLIAIRDVSRRWTATVAAGEPRHARSPDAGDIVVIHGNGRTLTGRDAVMDDLARTFRNFTVEQHVESEETVISGNWAFDRARVHTAITTRADGSRREGDSRTVTILRRDAKGGWLVARAVGVVEQK